MYSWKKKLYKKTYMALLRLYDDGGGLKTIQKSLLV
jgi:hypothetical protein